MTSVADQVRELRTAVLAMARALDTTLPGTREVISSLDTLCAYEMSERQKTLILTESVMGHMLADIDQILVEMESAYGSHTLLEWMAMLRHAVNGEDYKL